MIRKHVGRGRGLRRRDPGAWGGVAAKVQASPQTPAPLHLLKNTSVAHAPCSQSGSGSSDGTHIAETPPP